MKKVKLKLTFEEAEYLIWLLEIYIPAEHPTQGIFWKMTQSLITEVYVKLRTFTNFKFDKTKTISLSYAQGLAVWQIWLYVSLDRMNPHSYACLSLTNEEIRKQLGI